MRKLMSYRGIGVVAGLALVAIALLSEFDRSKPEHQRNPGRRITATPATSLPTPSRTPERTSRTESILSTARRTFARESAHEDKERTERIPNEFLSALEGVRHNRYASSKDGSLIPVHSGGGDALSQTYPNRFDARMTLSNKSHRINIVPMNAQSTACEVMDGVLVYPDAFASAHALRFPMSDRTEEFLLLESPDAGDRFRYALDLVDMPEVRRACGVYEFRDSEGTPRMRLHPAKAWDATGRLLEVAMEISGLEESASAISRIPSLLELTLTLNLTDASFPVLLDPTWSTSGATVMQRRQSTITRLLDGRILITGGYGIDEDHTAEIYDPMTRTFSMSLRNLNFGRYDHSAVLLPNGNVLLAGSATTSNRDTYETYNPGSDTWIPGSRLMPQARNDGTLTLLNTGDVLSLGGPSTSSDIPILYNPTGDTWTVLPQMTVGRRAHTATLLPNGKVVVVAGQYGVSTTSLYDPMNSSFTDVAPCPIAMYGHSATLLRDGRLLVVGGRLALGYSQNSYFYDYRTNVWSSPIPMAYACYDHAASLLPDGSVLVAGGAPSSIGDQFQIFNPSTNTWNSTGNIIETRNFRPVMTLMREGPAFLVGGTSSSGDRRAELCSTTSSTWTSTPSLNSARYYHSAGLLPDGDVLLSGGYNGTTALDDSWIYSSSTASWSSGPRMSTTRYLHTSTLLSSGQILIAGGAGGGSGSCELYDYTTHSWSPTGALTTPRYNHTATTLADGRVMLIGGYSGTALASTETYDPAQGRWSGAAAMATGRYQHTATRLADGRLLVLGGYNGSSPVQTYQIYNPVTNSWTLPANAPLALYLHSATLLPSGKVLVAGGNNGSSPQATCYLYNPSSNTWTTTGSLSQARAGHTAALLPSGEVLVAWGDPTSVVSQVYNPSTETWTATGTLSNVRYRHTATLLPNGKILVAGGYTGLAPLATCHLYTHTILSPATINTVNGKTSYPVAVEFGSTVSVAGTALRGGTEAGSGTMNTGNTDAPFIYLTRLASRDGNSSGGGSDDQSFFRIPADWHSNAALSFTVPSSSQISKGYYLLTLSSAGLQSEGKILKISNDASPPISGAVNDGPAPGDIDTQSSLTRIDANWTMFTDAQSGVTHYEWAIGTTLGGTDVQPFITVATATSAYNDQLALTDGITYYVTVRATNGGSLTTVQSSDGVTVSLNGPPTLSSPLPLNSTTTNVRRPQFSALVNAGDNGQEVWAEFSINGGAWISGSRVTTQGTSTYTPLSDLAEGTYSWMARAHDALDGTSSSVGPFSLTIDTTPPTVTSSTLTAPNASPPILIGGTTSAITWSTAGLAPSDLVSLYFSDNGGANYSTIVTGEANDGTYTWTVPSAESTSCRVKIRVTDLAGNFAEDTSNANFTIDSSIPTVDGMNSPNLDGYYGVGSVLTVQVSFTEAVTVSGTPRLTLRTDYAGGPNAVADYIRNSAPDTLEFGFTVTAGMQSNDLDALSAAALTLPVSASIRDAANNNASLTVYLSPDPRSLAVPRDLRIDTSAPRVLNVTSSNANGFYRAGSTIVITVQMDDIVTVNTAGGFPTLALNSAPSAVATYVSGSNSNTLSFSYIVAAGHNVADLDYSGIGALTANGSTIRDGAGNNASLALSTPGTAGSLGLNRDITIDTAAPGVDYVTSPSADRTYAVGETIDVAVVFSENVTVSGIPQLLLETGSNDALVNLTLADGLKTLTFRYTVAGGHVSPDLNYQSVNALTATGASILDTAGNAALLTLPATGSGNALSDRKAIVISTPVPAVDRVTSTTANGSYGPGSTILIDVKFLVAVTVSGTPTLTLGTGGTGRSVPFTSQPQSDTLRFTYLVSAGDFSTDLNYFDVNALNGTINDTTGSPAILTLPALTSPLSLGGSSSLFIDGAGPTAGTVSDGPGSDIVFQNSSSRIDATWTGFSDGSGVGIGSYEWAIGTTAGGAEIRAWTPTGIATTASATGLTLGNGAQVFVSVRALDFLSNRGNVATSNGVIVDTAPPSAGTVRDGTAADIDFQSSATLIYGNWSAFSDAISGVAAYAWAIGTSPGATDLMGWSSTAASTSASHTLSTALADGTRCYISVRATDTAGNTGLPATSDGVLVDLSAPTAGTVNDGPAGDIDVQTHDTSLTANWSGFTDPESGIDHYEWAIGTSSGATDTRGFVSVDRATSAFAPLTLTEGVTYFVTVKAVSLAGLEVRRSSDGILVDSQAPNAPTLIAPLNGATESGVPGVTFRWSSVTEAILYRFQLDTDTAFSMPLISDFTLVPTDYTSGILSPGTYHWRVIAIDAGGNSSAPSASFSFTITGASGLSMTLGPASIIASNEINTATDLAILQLRLTAGPLEDIQINSLTLTATGSLNEATDLSGLRLFQDVNSNGLLDSMDLPVGTSQAFLADNGTVTFDGLFQVLPFDASRDWILVADLNGMAPIGSTLSLSVAQMTHVNALALTTGRTLVPSGSFPLNGGLFSIVSSGQPGSLSIFPGFATPTDAYATPSEQAVEMLQLQLHSSSVEAIRISSLEVVPQGTGNDLTQIQAVYIAEDLNENGIYNAGIDRVIATTQFSGNGIPVVVGMDEILTAGRTAYWLIVYDFNGTAPLGTTFQTLVSPSSLQFTAAGMTSGASIRPLEADLSGALITIGSAGSPGALTVSGLPLDPPAGVMPFGRNIPALCFQLSAGGLEDVTVSQVRLRCSGSGDETSEVALLRLWEDVNGDEQFSATGDLLIAELGSPFSRDGAEAAFSSLTRSIPAGATRTWFVTLDVTSRARGGSTFQFSFDVRSAPPPLVASGLISNTFLTPRGTLVVGPLIEVQAIPSSSGKTRKKSCLASTIGSPSSSSSQAAPFGLILLFAIFWYIFSRVRTIQPS